MQAEYERRRRLRGQAVRRHERAFRTLGNWRLVTVAATALLAWINLYLLPLGAAVFLGLIVLHERIARKLESERRAEALYDRALARLNHRWAGAGPAGETFREPEHPYADELDLFGHGSLFQLLCLARTAAGEATLAAWLKAPAAVEEVRLRHEAIREMRPNLDLREDLALAGEDIRAGVHPGMLTRWASLPPVRFPSPARWLAALFTAAVLATFTGYMLQRWSWRPFVYTVFAQSVFAFALRDRVLTVHGATDAPARDLALLAQILARLEREPWSSPLLDEIRRRLAAGGQTASARIAHLRRLIEWHDWSHNLGFSPVARLLLWSTHLALALERWRRDSGPHIGEWLQALAELEALSSLAGYAAEHPGDAFPELLESGPRFEAAGLAHPLLAERAAVRNHVALGGSVRLLIVSGSNMSGKSTLLRAVGLNAVLAWAGAPVRATSLRLSPLAVGAAMRVQDSLQEGRSRFYSEILRIRKLLDLAASGRPLLFLLDELLSGTNSHDRRIGAEAILRTLVERGAAGMVTTHDLALAHIADQLPGASNVHFEDHIEDGRIAFDYIMRPGVVRKSNALELMRSVGLEV